jgi:hypothetical protein
MVSTSTGGTPMTQDEPHPPVNTGQTAGDALIAPRHPQCNIGAQVLHYLATGDNGGNPWYDQHFAGDIGVPAPQARAIADKAIQDCDSYQDEVATSSALTATSRAQATSEAAAATSEAQAAAKQERERVASCTSIGGEYEPGYGGACRSKVHADATGQPGVDCSSYAVILFGGNQITPAQLAQSKKSFPGCWP